MLKIFLVDDEFAVREAIKNNIDWTAYGYKFCGEAGDGELALPMIQKCKPDIVITDINMPFMDGLTLSRRIKKELPDTEVIILTGCEEFKYAKEAIKIGVSQYLLKSIDGEELLREINSLAEKIKEKMIEQEIKEKYKKEIGENIQKERKKLFEDLVTGSKTAAELLELADKLKIDLSSLWYNIVLIKTQPLNESYEEYTDSLIEIEQKLQTQDENIHPLIFDRNLEGKALLFQADTKEELICRQNKYLRMMKEILREYNHIRYFGGTGMPVNRLGEVPLSFEQASRAFTYRYLVPDSLIVNYSEIKQEVYLEKGAFDIRNINPKQMDRSKIYEFLKVGDRKEAIYFVEEFFKNLGNQAMESVIFRQYIAMDIYFCVIDFIEDLKLEREEIRPVNITFKELETREGTKAYIIEIIEKALELREKAASDRYADITNEVMRYIEAHYENEELSLNLLANHVKFSPNHLSTIFSQQTGQSFIKYLTDFRMNKAKELLCCTGKRSSEISIEVGYKDPHYFSYLFKKTQGMTPTQYRGIRNRKKS